MKHALGALFFYADCGLAAASKSPDHTAVTVPMFKGGVDDRKVLGDATDSGLLRYCDRLAPSSLVRMAYKKVSHCMHLQAHFACSVHALLLDSVASSIVCSRFPGLQKALYAIQGRGVCLSRNRVCIVTPVDGGWAVLLQVFEIPFNSANKWSLAVTSCPGDKSHQLILMKGAPEIILTKCSHHLHNKQEKEIDEVSIADAGLWDPCLQRAPLLPACPPVYVILLQGFFF
jgi:hypothetical protein